jgi:hypothetical protein
MNVSVMLLICVSLFSVPDDCFEVLVAAAREIHNDNIIRRERAAERPRVGKCMSRLKSGDYALCGRKLLKGGYSLLITRADVGPTPG